MSCISQIKKNIAPEFLDLHESIYGKLLTHLLNLCM